MPLYDYKCPKCGKITEILQTLSQVGDDVICSACNCEMEKTINSSYIINMPTGDSVGKTNYS